MAQIKDFKKAMNKHTTNNGDKSYNYVGDENLDIFFKLNYYRSNTLPILPKDEFNFYFSCFIRDPRFGMGERKVGRELLANQEVEPKVYEVVGRVDDMLINLNEANLTYFCNKLKASDNDLFKKWSPRLNSGKRSKELAKKLLKHLNISEKEYRKLIKLDSTAEYKLSNKVNMLASDFEKLPSLCILRHWDEFLKHYKDEFEKYIEGLNKGKRKINTSVTDIYSLYKAKCDEATKDTIFNKLFEGKDYGSILAICDGSGSMYNSSDSIGKATSIGALIGMKNSYLKNAVITFGNEPKIIQLTPSYAKNIKLIKKNTDCSNTDLKKVFKMLKKVSKTADMPEYLLILSDMEFDEGSSDKKDEVMKYFKKEGIKTKIIWWNFNTDSMTTPETDEYGNLFISGYAPSCLELLDNNFNAKEWLNALVSKYKEQIKLH